MNSAMRHPRALREVFEKQLNLQPRKPIAGSVRGAPRLDHSRGSRHNMTGRFTSSRGAIVGRFAVLSRDDLGDSEVRHGQIPDKLKGTDMNFETLQIELTKMAAWAIFAEAIAFAAGMMVLYFVLKAAIRDGINESKMGDTWRRHVNVARTTEEVKDLPPMRADR